MTERKHPPHHATWNSSAADAARARVDALKAGKHGTKNRGGHTETTKKPHDGKKPKAPKTVYGGDE